MMQMITKMMMMMVMISDDDTSDDQDDEDGDVVLTQELHQLVAIVARVGATASPRGSYDTALNWRNPVGCSAFSAEIRTLAQQCHRDLQLFVAMVAEREVLSQHIVYKFQIMLQFCVLIAEGCWGAGRVAIVVAVMWSSQV